MGLSMRRELIVDHDSLIIAHKKSESEHDETLEPEDQEENIQFILLPRDKETNSTFPIWIDKSEYIAIALAVENLTTSRPLTHDLFKNTLVNCGIMVNCVLITREENSVYFAELHCEQRGEEKITDSRPSDAIALALRFGSPIFIEEELLMKILSEDNTVQTVEYIEKNRPPTPGSQAIPESD